MTSPIKSPFYRGTVVSQFDDLTYVLTLPDVFGLGVLVKIRNASSVQLQPDDQVIVVSNGLQLENFAIIGVYGTPPIGIPGPQGVQGLQGAQGYQGAIGAQGRQGVQGSVGATGSQGNQGVVGSQGSQGVQGSQGSQGNQGSSGSQGPQGGLGADYERVTRPGVIGLANATWSEMKSWDNSGMTPLHGGKGALSSSGVQGVPIVKAGVYRAKAAGSFSTSSTTGRRGIAVGKNGTVFTDEQDLRQAMTAGSGHAFACAPVDFVCSAGDWLNAFYYQDSGGLLNISTCSISVEQIN